MSLVHDQSPLEPLFESLNYPPAQRYQAMGIYHYAVRRGHHGIQGHSYAGSSERTEPREPALMNCDVCIWSTVQMYCLQVCEQLDWVTGKSEPTVQDREERF